MPGLPLESEVLSACLMGVSVPVVLEAVCDVVPTATLGVVILWPLKRWLSIPRLRCPIETCETV